MAPILILFLAAMAYCGPINNLNSLPPNQSAEMNPNPMMTPPSNSQMTPTLPPGSDTHKSNVGTEILHELEAEIKRELGIHNHGQESATEIAHAHDLLYLIIGLMVAFFVTLGLCILGCCFRGRLVQCGGACRRCLVETGREASVARVEEQALDKIATRIAEKINV